MASTIYISDLDGTLLGSDSRISQKSSQIISELSSQGALITDATARTPATVVPLLQGTITTPPAIVMTGCARWDRRQARFTNVHVMSQSDVLLAMDICRHYGIHPFHYVLAEDGSTLDVFHGAGALNKAEENFYAERSNLALKRFHLGTPAPARALHSTMLFFAMGPADDIIEVAKGLKDRTECSVCCYPDIFNNKIYNLEIFPPEVDKAMAVGQLKADMGADRLVVFGDNLNDLTMFAAADLSVAVGNALPQVKEAADVVIEPNYTDSVARFIQKDFLGL